ncbi:MAG: CNNM domain-containing protein, partial [Pseudomonadota bacterium]
MILLIAYVLIALLCSFLCSIAESVILSVRPAHIELLKDEQPSTGELLAELKLDVNKPLAAILTLNTISNTAGATLAGAQATALFGSVYLGLFSAVLTVLILVFAEIIPKTIGAYYWRALAPITALFLKYLIKMLSPFIYMSELLTRTISKAPSDVGFSRDEFAVMADLSLEEGQLGLRESNIMKNLLLLRETHVKDAMTPMSVVFCLSENMLVDEFFHQYDHIRFSRIPIFKGDDEREITGFVLRSDLLLAQARGNGEQPLHNYSRDIPAALDYMILSNVFEEFLKTRTHMMLVVDEYGETKGVLTLEDVLETL